MIQRIQSIYLFAASVIMLFIFYFPLAQLELEGNMFLIFYHNRIAAIEPGIFSSVSTWPVTFLLIITILINIVTIFQFRKRIRQIRLCVFNIILHFGLVGMIYFFTQIILKQGSGIRSVFLWPVIIPFISIILMYLALKKIQKDELLIKSIDRFRR